METYFAPPERAPDDELREEVDFVAHNPLLTGLLKTAGGLLAVLNEQRQILAVNDTFLWSLGIDDPGGALGLRPGEAIQCVHAHEEPGGCGTSLFCSTCGAAIAIVSTLASEKTEERKCVAVVEKDGRKEDLCLHVRSCLITFGERRLVLLFLQDITIPERWAAIERVFFHDIANLIGGLQGAAHLLDGEDKEETRELADMLRQTTARLSNEVAIQRALLKDEMSGYQIMPQEVSASQVIEDLRRVFSLHPVAKGKSLRLPEAIPPASFTTDLALVLRILTNMVINALEATEEGGEVRLWIEQDEGAIAFCVWNKQHIPEGVARRVFQRHFSTKEESGRGLGTYAMKLFGEQFLGGIVGFTTSESDGTVFRLCLSV